MALIFWLDSRACLYPTLFYYFVPFLRYNLRIFVWLILTKDVTHPPPWTNNTGKLLSAECTSTIIDSQESVPPINTYAMAFVLHLLYFNDDVVLKFPDNIFIHHHLIGRLMDMKQEQIIINMTIFLSYLLKIAWLLVDKMHHQQQPKETAFLVMYLSLLPKADIGRYYCHKR